MSFWRRSNLVVDFIYSIMISPNQSTYQKHCTQITQIKCDFNLITIYFTSVRAQTIAFSEHLSFHGLTKYTRILFNKRSLSLNKFSISLKVHSLLTRSLFAISNWFVWHSQNKNDIEFCACFGKVGQQNKKYKAIDWAPIIMKLGTNKQMLMLKRRISDLQKNISQFFHIFFYWPQNEISFYFNIFCFVFELSHKINRINDKHRQNLHAIFP